MQKKLSAHIIFVLLLAASFCTAKEYTKPPTKAAVFFYRASEWIDHYVTQGIDTNYIGLPEHSWRFAYTNGMVGINSIFGAENMYDPKSESLYNRYLHIRSTPSVNLGFQAGFRGFGFGYSWDAVHAYSQNMNFSLGGKYIGIEFMRQRSRNTQASIGDKAPSNTYSLNRYDVNNEITNTTVNVWYALNSAHYSHNAAIKQSYIQKKTAGSLLLQATYLSTRTDIDSRLFEAMGNLIGVETHQVGIGLGYGINYTPNNGKVLLHASAIAQLICFSHNLITQYDTIHANIGGGDSLIQIDRLYRISSRYPVHVTGTMRAAVSWEINKWVHLSAWAQANNIRFMASTMNADVNLSNWNWQVNLIIGVRLGAGYERRKYVLDSVDGDSRPEDRPIRQPRTKLPKWLTDFFYSPRP